MRMFLFIQTLGAFFSFTMSSFAADSSLPLAPTTLQFSQEAAGSQRKLKNIISDLTNLAASMTTMKTLKRGELIEIQDGKIELSIGNVNKFTKPLQSLSRTLKNQLSPGSAGRASTLEFGEQAVAKLEGLYSELTFVIKNDPLAVIQLLICKLDVVTVLLLILS